MHSAKRVVSLGVPAGAGDAALGVDDDAATLDAVVGDQGGEGEDGGGGVAAGVGDQVGGGDAVAVEFGQAIDGLGQAGGVGVVVVVPVAIDLGVLEPVVGAQVDDADAPLAEFGGGGHAGGVGQAEEGDAGALGELVGVERLAGEVDPAGEAGVDGVESGRSSWREVAITTRAPGCRRRMRTSSQRGVTGGSHDRHVHGLTHR